MKILSIIFVGLVAGVISLGSVFLFAPQNNQNNLGTAPGSTISYTKDLIPVTTTTYDIGTSTKEYRNGFIQNLTVSGTLTATVAPTLSATTTITNGVATKLLYATTSVMTGLLNCDTIDTDEEGTLLCGSDASGANTAGFTDTGTIVRLQTATDAVELNALSSIGAITFGNGSATSTLISSATSTIINDLQVKGNLFGSSLEVSAIKIATSTAVATSTFNGFSASILNSNTRLRVAELVSCDTIDTDDQGVLRCGADADTATPNISGFTDTGSIVRLQTAADAVELNNLSSIGSINFGNGSATSTLISSATSTIINDLQVKGNLFAGTLEISALKIATSTAVATSTFNGLWASVGSFLQLVTDALHITGRIESTGTATSSFDGGLAVRTNGGLSSSAGLTISGGDLLLSGKLNQTLSGATSTLASGLFASSSVLVSGRIVSAPATSCMSSGVINWAASTGGCLSLTSDMTISSDGKQLKNQIFRLEVTHTAANLNLAFASSTFRMLGTGVATTTSDVNGAVDIITFQASPVEGGLITVSVSGPYFAK